MAIDKLRKEMKENENDKALCRIALYLIGRCEASESLCEDVLKDGKTLRKCMDYVTSCARKEAVGGCACIEDNTVFEWAEDYYRNEAAPEPVKSPKKAKTKQAKKMPKEAKKQAKTEENKPILTVDNGQMCMF